jgi:hypothetical protein
MAAASGQSENRQTSEAMSFFMEALARLKGHCSKRSYAAARVRGSTETRRRLWETESYACPSLRPAGLFATPTSATT